MSVEKQYLLKIKMNIHEYQAKELLKEYGAPVTDGVVVLKPEDFAEN